MTRVLQGQDLMVVTDGGTIIRLPVDQVNTYSRYAKGVRIIKPSDGEQVVSIHPVAAMEEDDLVSLEEGEEGAEAAPAEAEASQADGEEAVSAESDEGGVDADPEA